MTRRFPSRAVRMKETAAAVNFVRAKVQARLNLLSAALCAAR
jgi:hypothetical protein